MGRYKKVTTVDVAELAGVSQSTVSMILSRNPRVNFSSDTVERVLTAAEQLGYNNRKVYKQPTDVSKNILVVCPGFMNPYYTMLIESVQDSCAKAGFGILTFSTLRMRDEEERLLSMNICWSWDTEK